MRRWCYYKLGNISTFYHSRNTISNGNWTKNKKIIQLSNVMHVPFGVLTEREVKQLSGKISLAYYQNLKPH